MKEQGKSEVLRKSFMAGSVYQHSDTKMKTRHLFFEPTSSSENLTFDFLTGKINLEGFGEM